MRVCWLLNARYRKLFLKVKPHSMPRTFFGIVYLRSASVRFTPFPSSQFSVRLVNELCANQLNRFLCLSLSLFPRMCLCSEGVFPITTRVVITVENARNTPRKIRGNRISQPLRKTAARTHKMNDLEWTFFFLRSVFPMTDTMNTQNQQKM